MSIDLDCENCGDLIASNAREVSKYAWCGQCGKYTYNSDGYNPEKNMKPEYIKKYRALKNKNRIPDFMKL